MSIPAPSALVSSHHVLPLHSGWQLAATTPGAFASPDEMWADTALAWHAAPVPGTVARSFHAEAVDSFAKPADYDAHDWWYRSAFPVPETGTGYRLRFDGLATLADVWLNRTLLLSSDNMFVPHVVDVDRWLHDENELVICFRSLTAALAERRPRPRWRTALVNHQQLRWFRTTLLGRIPGWTPPIAPVGPWRDIVLEQVRRVDVARLDLQCAATVNDDGRSGTGHLRLEARLKPVQSTAITADASLYVGTRQFPLTVRHDETQIRLTGDLEISDVPLWWPHTHGDSARLPCHLEVNFDGEAVCIDCGDIGFKDLRLDRTAGQVRFVVNGVPVFCRGACWTINDFVALSGNRDRLLQALEMARDMGLNMLRVGGTMVYESDDFYELCDELGIMVWQDFMFANMDYPVDDEAFRANIDREVQAQLHRLQTHPCIAAYCGNSEVQQQAAMVGLPNGEWSNEFFDEELPRHCAYLHSGIPYFPSTPCEGALPFHVGTGVSHYYGVGAYRRPLMDLRHAGVKFTAECLGFSNVPEPETCELITGGLVAPHHPAWKARVPRDSGAGWDFEDIRDHYLKLLFDLDPVALRSQDLNRYLALSRAVTGEVMYRAYAEWRRPHSACGGALVWFFKDLWPGAGWGIIDGDNLPKAAFYYLKRAWSPRAVLITDEGLDGLHLHVLNDGPLPLEATLELQLYQAGRVPLATATKSVEVTAHGATTLCADAMIGHFTDLTFAYRFGPPAHDVVVARLTCNTSGTVLGEDFHFPHGLNRPFQDAAQVALDATAVGEGDVLLRLHSDCLLQSVAITARGFLPQDNYFHLAPGRARQVRLIQCGETPLKFKGTVSALNLRETLTIRG